MKAYVVTAGTVFGLLTLAHIWRAFVEAHMVKEPWSHSLHCARLPSCLGRGVCSSARNARGHVSSMAYYRLRYSWNLVRLIP